MKVMLSLGVLLWFSASKGVGLIFESTSVGRLQGEMGHFRGWSYPLGVILFLESSIFRRLPGVKLSTGVDTIYRG